MVARSKSFTGCWTCRGRKIRCDLREPSCTQCLKAKIKCGGYHVRLVWEDDENKERRRKVATVRFPPHMMYKTYDELDDTLLQIDAAEFESPSDTEVRGPFAVFRCRKTLSQKSSSIRKPFNISPSDASVAYPKPRQLANGSIPHRDDTELPLEEAIHSSARPDTMIEDVGHASLVGTTADTPTPLTALDAIERRPWVSKLPHTEINNNEGDWGTADEILRSLEDSEFQFLDEYTTDVDLVDVNHTVVGQPLDLIFEDPSAVSSGNVSATHPTDHTAVSRAGRNRLTELAQMLLDHYRAEVMPYMSIVINTKNIWQAIYLPRVIAAIGDVSYRGGTTVARETTIVAVLSASAFNMALRLELNGLSSKYYAEIGQQLRDASHACLLRCFKEGRNVGKYKDFLVALHAIANIEYIKGDTVGRESRVAAIERLISLRLANKPKVSHKASLLHKTCAMAVLLVRVAESWPGKDTDRDDIDRTNRWIDQCFEDLSIVQTDDQGKRMSALQQLKSRQVPLSYMENAEQLDEYFRQYTVGDAESRVAFSAELMFALPESLVYLFKESVRDSRAALWEREKQGHAQSFSPDLALRCTIIEASLQNWKFQYRSPVPDQSEGDYSVENRRLRAIHHHTLAFYEALVIYHYRVAKDVHPNLLQSHVVRIVEHLEEVNRQNDLNGDRPVAIPYIFAGFVGACEVAESNSALMQRYQGWFRKLESYGLASYGAAAEIVNRIHARRALGESGCDWWTLVRDEGCSFSLQ